MTTFRVLIVVALQTLALAYMIFDRQTMLNSSRVVTLKVIPVDPRDIFRGDYVVLSYDVSRLDMTKIDGEDKFASGDTAYVTLQNQGEEWKAVAISHKPMASVPGGVAMKATVQYADAPSEDTTSISPVMVTLTYGIESYFVPQGTGRAIEVEAAQGKLSADIAVDPSGRAAIKAMRRQGKVFYVEGVF
jgi:uncharacterized membrane-anchored protein